MQHWVLSVVNNVSVKLVQYRRCSQWTWSRKEVVVGDLLVLYKVAWTCYRVENYEAQKLIPLFSRFLSVSSGFAYKSGLVDCRCSESWAYMFTEDVWQSRGQCWTRNTVKTDREDGKHPLRPDNQTWAVLNQFKTLVSTWQALHISLVSISPNSKYKSHNFI